MKSMMNRRQAMLGALAMGAALAGFALGATEARAGDGEGHLYASQHFQDSDLKSMGMASRLEVFVYTLDGALISSGLGTGSWQPGRMIPLKAGDYLVELGNERTRHHLRKVTVAAGSVTELETGWVAVTTWPRAKQPLEGCKPWGAELRAYVVVDGKRHLVMSNASAPFGDRGRIQLPVGTYEIHWNGLATSVEVKANAVTHLATGVSGPFIGSDVRISAEKSDAVGVPYTTLCTDGPTHVLAGNWWVSQVEKIEDYPYERRVWQEAMVPAIDEGDERPLRPDRPKGRIYKGDGSSPAPLDADQLKALRGYQEGSLKNVGGGGKFNLDDKAF